MRVQLEALNAVEFTEGEWLRFVDSWLDKPSDGIVEKTARFTTTTYTILSLTTAHPDIYCWTRKNITRNKLQVIKQFEQDGYHANRYDVTILVNGSAAGTGGVEKAARGDP